MELELLQLVTLRTKDTFYAKIMGSLSNGVGERTSNFMVNVISLGLRELFSLKPFLILLGSE